MDEIIDFVLKLDILNFLGGVMLFLCRYVLDWVFEGVVEVVLFYVYYSFNDIFLFEFLLYLKFKGVGLINVFLLFFGFFIEKGILYWYFVFLEIKVVCMLIVYIFYFVDIYNL